MKLPNKFQWIIIIVLLIISACKKSDYKQIVVKKFLVEEKILGSAIYLAQPPQCPDGIWLMDSLILIKNESANCDDYFFNVYNLRTLELICQFAPPGRGPEEYTSISFNGQSNMINSDLMITLFDHGRLQFQQLNLSATSEAGRIEIVNTVPMPEAISWAINPFLLSEKKVIGRAMRIQGRYFKYDDNNLEYFPFYPPIKREIPDDFVHNIYSSCDFLSPDGTLFVSALTFFKQLDVFTSDLEHKFSLVFPDSPTDIDFFKDKNQPMGDKLVYFYTDIHVSNKHIYAICQNIKLAEISQMDRGLSELHVFNYDGEPLAKLILNHTIFRITVNNEDSKLYGVPGFQSIESSDLPIICFDLPELQDIKRPDSRSIWNHPFFRVQLPEQMISATDINEHAPIREDINFIFYRSAKVFPERHSSSGTVFSVDIYQPKNDSTIKMPSLIRELQGFDHFEIKDTIKLHNGLSAVETYHTFTGQYHDGIKTLNCSNWIIQGRCTYIFQLSSPDKTQYINNVNGFREAIFSFIEK